MGLYCTAKRKTYRPIGRVPVGLPLYRTKEGRKGEKEREREREPEQKKPKFNIGLPFIHSLPNFIDPFVLGPVYRERARQRKYRLEQQRRRRKRKVYIYIYTSGKRRTATPTRAIKIKNTVERRAEKERREKVDIQYTSAHCI